MIILRKLISLLKNPPGKFDYLLYLMLIIGIVDVCSNVGMEFWHFYITFWLLMVAAVLWLVRLFVILASCVVHKKLGSITFKAMICWLILPGSILTAGFGDSMQQIRFSLSRTSLDDFIRSEPQNSFTGMVGLFYVKEVSTDGKNYYLKVTEGLFNDGLLVYNPVECNNIFEEAYSHLNGPVECTKLYDNWWACVLDCL